MLPKNEHMRIYGYIIASKIIMYVCSVTYWSGQRHLLTTLFQQIRGV